MDRGSAASSSCGRAATSSTCWALASSPRSSRSLKASKFPAWYMSFASEVKCMMWVQTRFRKSASCETIIAVLPVSPPVHVLWMKSTSQFTASTSRWFVGSSSSSRPARWATAQARARRICQPPLRAPTAFSSISSASKPTSARALLKSASDAAVLPWFRFRAYSRAGVEGAMPRRMASCLRCTTRNSCGKPSMSFLAIRAMSVVLPVPLAPTTP
mmetsp:Transcript_6655/g.20613  ORF Transcript_6655/g.20613 Transcript_6655/m.20613 type:complete len:215 (-) Transcript_6655:222-866(-)